MPPAFLNSREDAGLIWTVIVLAFVLYKVPGVFGNLAQIAWLIIKPPLVFLFGGAALYCAGILAIASELGVWETTATKETVYWFLGTGIVLAGHATEERPDPDYARTLIRRAVRVAILLEFIVNFYVFPLGVELVFVPLVGLLGIVEAWNNGQAQRDPSLAKITGGSLAILGWAVLVSVLVRIGVHPGELLTRGTLERVLVVPALTITFIPFLYLVAWHAGSLSKCEGVSRLRPRPQELAQVSTDKPIGYSQRIGNGRSHPAAPSQYAHLLPRGDEQAASVIASVLAGPGASAVIRR